MVLPRLRDVPGDREVVAHRRHRLAPPPWRTFEALTEEVEQWLSLRPGEEPPRVVRAVHPSLVEWSSMWAVSPTDSIVFTITPDGQGSAVTLQWLSANPPEERGVGLVRHRLNFAIGGELREFLDTYG